MAEETQPILIYTTFPDAQAATEAARILLDQRLIACANIFPPHIALYRWEGKLEQSQEVALILKTTQINCDKIVDKLKLLHPYDCPCILALPITGGHPTFLQWISQETSGV